MDEIVKRPRFSKEVVKRYHVCWHRWKVKKIPPEKFVRGMPLEMECEICGVSKTI